MEPNSQQAKCERCWGTGKLKIKIGSYETIANCTECGGIGVAPTVASTGTPERILRDPTREELKSPRFNAVWDAIKKWDLSRDGNRLYAGATGTDVCTILDAIDSAPVPSEPGESAEQFTINDGARLIKKIEACEGMAAKLILLQHFGEKYAAKLRAQLQESEREIERLKTLMKGKTYTRPSFTIDPEE